jgi:hypothetical protein
MMVPLAMQPLLGNDVFPLPKALLILHLVVGWVVEMVQCLRYVEHGFVKVCSPIHSQHRRRSRMLAVWVQTYMSMLV